MKKLSILIILLMLLAGCVSTKTHIIAIDNVSSSDEVAKACIKTLSRMGYTIDSPGPVIEAHKQDPLAFIGMGMAGDNPISIIIEAGLIEIRFKKEVVNIDSFSIEKFIEIIKRDLPGASFKVTSALGKKVIYFTRRA